MVKRYQLKQQFGLGGERFEVKDEADEVAYRVEGSFLKWPKRFSVYDAYGLEISQINGHALAILPRFEVLLAHGHPFTVRKKLNFWRDQYVFEGLPFLVDGTVWDLEITLKQPDGQELARISKEVFRLSSTYQLTVWEETYTDLVVSLAMVMAYVDLIESRS